MFLQGRQSSGAGKEYCGQEEILDDLRSRPAETPDELLDALLKEGASILNLSSSECCGT